MLIGKCVIIHGRARHPQSQGLVKQANGTLKTMLATMKLQEKDEGKKEIGHKFSHMLFNLNTYFHSKTKQTPYEIIFKRKPNLGEKGNKINKLI